MRSWSNLQLFLSLTRREAKDESAFLSGFVVVWKFNLSSSATKKRVQPRSSYFSTGFMFVNEISKSAPPPHFGDFPLMHHLKRARDVMCVLKSLLRDRKIESKYYTFSSLEQRNAPTQHVLIKKTCKYIHV